MSAVQQAAAAYLAARIARTDALQAASAADVALMQAEKALQDAVMNTDDEDGGTAVVHGNVVIIFPEEYWDRPKGDQLQVHILAEQPAR